jgi:(1->4)-alpha-D-glucan 1-alpha-D-glucosylmutase
VVPIRATYRLQLHAGFPLSRARELVPYLDQLGISHLHCSPLLQARRGSRHGYDVTDPTRINPDIGTEADLEALVSELRERDMGLLLDIVPNHMAATSENPAWEDVLMHGPASRFARWFDVEWRATERELRYRVLLPVLGDHRARVIERGEIGIQLREGLPRLRYYEHDFPLDPATLPLLLRPALRRCEEMRGREDPACRTLSSIVEALRRLPRRTAKAPAAVARRRETATREGERLRSLSASNPHIDQAIAEAVDGFGQGPGGGDRLRRLLDAQVYRLVYWRRAAREINYRRFFDVNDLIALHMEDPEVFAETHALVLEWVRRGWIDGFRIDHPDGLLDPPEYFRRLSSAAFPGIPTPPIVVEKILSHGEQLRSDWPVAGTTGYDFLNQAEALFIEPEGFDAIEREYRRIIRQPLEFAAIARLGKRHALESGLSAGVRRLAERLLKLSGPDAGFPLVRTEHLARAIVETIASLPVYRTYVDSRTPVPATEDRRLLEDAVEDARRRGRAQTDALHLLSMALLGTDGPMRLPEREGLRLRFVQRFQQLSGPATAKGVEDTAFYSYAPLLSRNEVGGAPEAGLSGAVEGFHQGNEHRARRWPGTLVTVTTHDTKRTADLRARLDVLSELPDQWAKAVDRWRAINLVHQKNIGDRREPDPNTIYHLFQATLGIWPSDIECLSTVRERLKEYGLKAVREAKVRTSWTEPDETFEAAVAGYLDAIVDPARSPEFVREVSEFVSKIAPAGLWNALSRTLIHLTAPGVADLYQGDELWNFALVDPDNRRPVDFEQRRRMLAELPDGSAQAGMSQAAFLKQLVEQVSDGRLKLQVTRAALRARRVHPELFLSGSYERLEIQGDRTEHVVGFARQHGTARAVVLAGRLMADRVLQRNGGPPDAEFWRGTRVRLPGGDAEWTCALSGAVLSGSTECVELDQVFGEMPLALLLG